MPDLILTFLFPSNNHQSGTSMRLFFTFTFIVLIMMVIVVTMMIVMVLMTVLAMTMMTDIVINNDRENGDFSDENIVVYDKNDSNDDDGDDYDGDDDDNNDDYDVGDYSRPPQLVSTLSDSLLIMI